MPVICLVRHGQASFGAHDYDALSDLGREQSRVLGAELARRRLRDPVVACGSLHRQRDTAGIVAATLGASVSRDARWDEYDHVALISRYVDPLPASQADSREVQSLLDVALQAWVTDTDTDGGGWAEFSSAATGALGDLVASLGRGRDAVVVTSGGVLAAVCGALLSAPPAGIVALNRVAVNAAVTTLIVGAGGVRLLSFNDHAHFAGERRHLLTYR